MTLGALFREGNVVQVMDAISVNDSNTEGWQIQDEAFLELLQTFPKKLHCLLTRDSWRVISVQDTESQEGTVAVGCERGFCQGCQVVHVVECWTLVLIVAGQEEVDMIRGPTPKIVRQVSASEISCCRGRQFITISHLIELHVFLNIFCKLYSVSSLSNTQE